jgi:hypothetical protein
MTIKIAFDADIVLMELMISKFNTSGVDNEKLAKEVLKNIDIRLTDDPNDTKIEDSMLEIPEHSEANKLISAINDFVKPKGLKNVEQWGQIHRPLESTNLHRHADYPYAWVYYVQIPPGSGDLTFWFFDRFKNHITPTVGSIILFPGWMQHSVSRNTGKDIRISVSGNLNFFTE